MSRHWGFQSIHISKHKHINDQRMLWMFVLSSRKRYTPLPTDAVLIRLLLAKHTKILGLVSGIYSKEQFKDF